jgi:hypothetical protein
VHLSSVEGAVHGAALVIRGGHFPWLIEGPGVRSTRRDRKAL